jgi:L-seryl-tRNA(Ser) seleniumtransferase
VQDSVKSGADVITFSGDKLLGGPQAGLIVGKRGIIDRIKSNPLTRALRIDKMTLAALEATLRLYRDESRAMADIPTLRMLTEPLAVIEHRAGRLAGALEALNDSRLQVALYPLPSRAGGGSLPLLALPSCCVGLRVSDRSANSLEKALRDNQPPIIGRIENDLLIFDPRTLQEEEVEIIAGAFHRILKTTT